MQMQKLGKSLAKNVTNWNSIIKCWKRSKNVQGKHGFARRVKTPRFGEVSKAKCLSSRSHDRDILVTIMIIYSRWQNVLCMKITSATSSHDRDLPMVKRFSETTSSFVFG